MDEDACQHGELQEQHLSLLQPELEAVRTGLEGSEVENPTLNRTA